MLACIWTLGTYLVQPWHDRWSWPRFKVIRVWESRNFYANYFTKYSMYLNRIWCAVETYWSDEAHFHFVSADQYSSETMQKIIRPFYRRERMLFRRFCRKALSLTCVQTSTDRLCQTWFDDRDHELYILIPVSSFNVTVSTRKQKLLSSFSHNKFHNWFRWNIGCCHNLFVCFKLKLYFFCTINSEGRELFKGDLIYL